MDGLLLLIDFSSLVVVRKRKHATLFGGKHKEKNMKLTDTNLKLNPERENGHTSSDQSGFLILAFFKNSKMYILASVLVSARVVLSTGSKRAGVGQGSVHSLL